MSGITAEQAREIAESVESTAVANLLIKCEKQIAKSAQGGYLCERIVMDDNVSDAVRDRLINILIGRGFKVENHPSAIGVFWGE